MRKIDLARLLPALWDAIEVAGGKPSENKVMQMARIAGARFDDKTAREILFRRKLGSA